MNPKQAKHIISPVLEELFPALFHVPNVPGVAKYGLVNYVGADDETTFGGMEGCHEYFINDEQEPDLTIQQQSTIAADVETRSINDIAPSSAVKNVGYENGIEVNFSREEEFAPSLNCPKCGNNFLTAGAKKLHMRACLNRIEKQRKCDICNKVFKNASYLKDHILLHIDDSRRCTRCSRVFSDDEKWKAHMQRHQRKDKLDAAAEAIALQNGGQKVVLKRFRCSFCSKNFIVSYEKGKITPRFMCETCRDNGEHLKRRSSNQKPKLFCERCGRKFVYEGYLQRHLQTCDGTIKYSREVKDRSRSLKKFKIIISFLQ